MTARARRLSPALRTPIWLQALLISTAVVFLLLFIGVPLAAVFSQAFEKGAEAYWVAISDAETQAAIRLTLLTASISVCLNVAFGLAASWVIAKYDFLGKKLLTTLIDLPFSISPVISGLIFVLLFGRQGVFGELLSAHDVKIIFAVPGIVIATTFVTFPFVAKEVLPLMQAQGNDAEEAALTLGANGFQVFWLVTLPKIRWGLLYGVILCNARAMGEFGAVSVVSGHIRGLTNTMPLHVEILYNDNNLVGSFAVASLLTLLALVTLAARKLIEWRQSGGPRVSVVVKGLQKRFAAGDLPAVRDVSFIAPSGAITSLLGPSGSGKTTVLRMIAGLEEPDAGSVAIEDQICTRTPVQHRGVGFVFQGYALFEHLDVRGNIAFGLRLKKTPKAELEARVEELLQLVQLGDLGKRLPNQLSGGQRQRVAFARALATRPRVLLLDEPFGALDTRVRFELRDWLGELNQKTHVTTLLVTHDQDEALELSKQVIVMNEGKVEQAGAPNQVYDHPASPFVASFIGNANILRGQIRGGKASMGSAIAVNAPDGALDGAAVNAFVRPHEVKLARPTDSGSGSLSLARIETILRVGANVRVNLRLPSDERMTVHLRVQELDQLGLGEGDRVLVDIGGAKVFMGDYSI